MTKKRIKLGLKTPLATARVPIASFMDVPVQALAVSALAYVLLVIALWTL